MGGCRCGELRYELTSGSGPIWNCHCRFCRQVHGAAFTTVAIMPRNSFRWSDASGLPSIYETPLGSIRHFCGICASPICNFPLERALICLVVASLDDELDRTLWAHVNLESKAAWFQIGDDLPRFQKSPDLDELELLAKSNLP